MNKSLIALLVAGSLALAGCSSSDSANGANDHTPNRPEPVDPGFGVQLPPVQPPVDNTPDWGIEPTDPDFGVQIPPVHLPEEEVKPEHLPAVDSDWGIDAPEIGPKVDSIDRNKVRDAVRSRLNG